MRKKIVVSILLMVLAFLCFSFYDYFRAGLHTAPKRQDGDFLLSYKNGLRAVMRGIDNEKTDRTYLGYPATGIPSWYRDTWSICRPPTTEESVTFMSYAEVGPGGRLDAVCEINADGDIFIRGWIASVPDL